MTTDMYDDNLILGYVEDELTTEEKAAFQEALNTDPRLASLVKSMMQDRQMLMALDQVTAPMELGDYVSSQLERQMLLGPLPQRRKATPTNHSTPQSRSHSRMMRIWSYGSLAAMFLIVVGLMYHHIGRQSLIERTENLSFDNNASQGSTVVMKQEKPRNNTIDNLLKLPPAPVRNEQTTSAKALTSKFVDKSLPASDAGFGKLKKRELHLGSTDMKSVENVGIKLDGISDDISANQPMPTLVLTQPMTEETKTVENDSALPAMARDAGIGSRTSSPQSMFTTDQDANQSSDAF